jgi:hypothetical protein
MKERDLLKTRRDLSQPVSVVCVIEIYHNPDKVGGGVGYLLSLPSREDVTEKEWNAPLGILSPAQLQDLSANVAVVVEDAVVTWSGVQGVLPMA